MRSLLGSLLFNVLSVLLIIFYSFIVVLSYPFSIRFRHTLVRNFLRLYIKLLTLTCGIKYHVHGLENIPKDKCGIIMSKHQSAWETFFLPTIFHDPAVIVKRELLWVPFFGWGLAASDPIAINRSKTSNAMQQIISKGKKCLDEGRFVLLYPEGTRIAYGKIGNYRLGGARLAHATGYPIIPVAHNAGKFWPKRKFIKTPGTVQVVIGPAIQPEGRTAEELLELTKTWIEDTITRMDRIADTPVS